MTERSVFISALEINEAQSRAEFLDRACGEDTAMRCRVERLLRLHHQDNEFLNAPIAVAATLDPSHDSAVAVGSTIGRYKLLEQVGEGGMGSVYVAEQTEPVRRKVALKVIKAGMDTAQVVARFEAERQTLALMSHPNIAKVLDAGATESGRPYFVMELVKGVPITEYCDHHELDLRQRLDLFVTVCQAVQHAHQKGIIHRDLKPSNVLVELHDVVAVPKVIDFGVAKATNQQLTERTLHTGIAQMIGTPLYMSPEQAQLGSIDVDTRSDIYSLGVLLYELLTGTTPFSKQQLSESGFDEMRRVIREEVPLKPSAKLSTLKAAELSTVSEQTSGDPRKRAHLPGGELDWIVMKALEKDRTRRYETANAFANDLLCYLNDRPVEAGPPSAGYRLRKLAARNRGLFFSSSLVAATLMIGVLATGWQAVRATHAEREWRREAIAASQQADAARDAEAEARRQTATAQANEQEAVKQREEAQRSRYYAEIRLANRDWENGNFPGLHQILESNLPSANQMDHRSWEWHYLFSRCHLDEQTLHGVFSKVNALAWSPDGNLIAAASNNGAAWLWNATTGEVVRSFHSFNVLKTGVAWSPDSRYMAWSSVGPENAIRIWDRGTDEIQVLKGHTFSLRGLAFGPDGSRLASTSLDKTVMLWDVATRQCVFTFGGHTKPVSSVAWQPSGMQLATAGDDGVRVWGAKTGQQVHHNKGQALAVDWHPNGHQLAIGRPTGWALLNVDGWLLEHSHDQPLGVRGLAFSHSGDRIALASEEARVLIYDAASGQVNNEIYGHLARVTAVSWSPTDTRLAAADADGMVKIWNPSVRSSPLKVSTRETQWQTICWLKDGHTLATVSGDGRAIEFLKIPDGITSRTVTGKDDHVVRVSQSGQHVALVPRKGNDKSIFVSNPLTGQIIARMQSELRGAIQGAAWSDDGSMFAAFDGSNLEVWRLEDAQLVCRWSGAIQLHSMDWSPDGSTIALGGAGDKEGESGWTQWLTHLHVIDVARGQRISKLRLGRTGRGTRLASVAWNRDGRFVATGGADGVIAVWEPEHKRQICQTTAHAVAVVSISWSPDNQRLASLGLDDTLNFLNPHTGRTVFSLSIPTGRQSQLAWDPGGHRIAVTLEKGGIRVFDATAGYEFVASDEKARDRARVFVRRASNHDAIGNLSKAIGLSPEDPELWYRRAHAQVKLKDWEKALGDANQCLLLQPADTRYWYLRAFTNWSVKRWHAAAVDLREFTRLSDHFHDLLALAYQAAGNTRAATDLRQELENQLPHTTDLNARIDLVWTLALLASEKLPSQELVDLAKQLVAEEPSRVFSRVTLGSALYRARRFGEAHRQLEKALSLSQPTARLTDQACSGCLLAMTQYRLGNSLEAARLLKRVDAATQTLADNARFSEPNELKREVSLRLLHAEASSLLGKNDK